MFVNGVMGACLICLQKTFLLKLNNCSSVGLFLRMPRHEIVHLVVE